VVEERRIQSALHGHRLILEDKAQALETEGDLIAKCITF
jgi:hypothetical protein